MLEILEMGQPLTPFHHGGQVKGEEDCGELKWDCVSEFISPFIGIGGWDRFIPSLEKIPFLDYTGEELRKKMIQKSSHHHSHVFHLL